LSKTSIAITGIFGSALRKVRIYVGFKKCSFKLVLRMFYEKMLVLQGGTRPARPDFWF
jgi:hypothetical protein